MKSSDNKQTKLRLQVFLSRQGVCSRRRALGLVQEGSVTLNGLVCREPSTPVDPDKDSISVNGKTVQRKAYDYILLNKPAGYTTTKADRFAEKTVLDLLPDNARHLSPVGRLDRDTEGLLLLTNDGDTAYKLTHPKFRMDKTYSVRIHGRLEPGNKARLEKGIFVEGRKTSPARITKVKIMKERTELLMTIHEGRKRQIRVMFAKAGHNVIFLKRLTQGPLTLGSLKTGKWRRLTGQEIQQIQNI